MADLKELVVEIFDATGEPGGNSLPFWASKKAPFGEWLLSEKSTAENEIQKTLRNRKDGGPLLVMVDPESVPTEDERQAGTPLWECEAGKNFFNQHGCCAVWLYQAVPLGNGKHGVPIVEGKWAWTYMDHLRKVVIVIPPEEPPVIPPVEPPEEPGEEEGEITYEDAVMCLALLLRFVKQELAKE